MCSEAKSHRAVCRDVVGLQRPSCCWLAVGGAREEGCCNADADAGFGLLGD